MKLKNKKPKQKFITFPPVPGDDDFDDTHLWGVEGFPIGGPDTDRVPEWYKTWHGPVLFDISENLMLRMSGKSLLFRN